MIEIKSAQITGEQLAALFAASGIHRPTEDVKRMQRMLDNANVCLTAWDGAKLVGVLRGVSDKSYCTFVSDLAVARAYQKQGIGSQLVHTLRQKQGPDVSVILLSAPSAMHFYPKLGFENVATAYKVQRTY